LCWKHWADLYFPARKYFLACACQRFAITPLKWIFPHSGQQEMCCGKLKPNNGRLRYCKHTLVGFHLIKQCATWWATSARLFCYKNQRDSHFISGPTDRPTGAVVTWSVFVLSRSSISARSGQKFIRQQAMGPGPHALINSFWYTKACVEACERAPHAASLPPPPLPALTQKTFVVIPTPLLDALINLSGSLSARAITIITQKCCTRLSEPSGKTSRAAQPKTHKRSLASRLHAEISPRFFVFFLRRARVAQYFPAATKTIGN